MEVMINHYLTVVLELLQKLKVRLKLDPEVRRIWNILNSYFSSEVPNPANYPECFMWYLKIYKQDLIDRRKYG